MKRNISGTVVSLWIDPNPEFAIHDPIQLHMTDYGAGRGAFVAVCYDMAWACYFGGMGDKTIQEFILCCGPEYLVNKMVGQYNARTKTHEKYRHRVIETIQAALRSKEGST